MAVENQDASYVIGWYKARYALELLQREQALAGAAPKGRWRCRWYLLLDSDAFVWEVH